ncbi:MAG: sn-glycerol-1-phosphate dehydrogenase [Clostridia bacterium]|nr:sn-glycerol-1-phosphate dehydrogenase [Clostridia bacterium]
MTDRIQTLLNMNGVCACGKIHPVSLQTLVMERGALAKIPEAIRGLGNYTRLVMICDDNTYAAAGQTVEGLCAPLWRREGKNFQTVCLHTPAHGLRATETVVSEVMASMEACDLLLAVGSGTIHDITRYIATELGLDFVSVPTAASVDGFLSSIAAMTWHGVKRSFPAKPPVALISDSDVLAAAPYALTASGVGDLLGKYTALFDWRVSHMVTGEYICEQVISLEEAALREVLACQDAVAARDPKAVETVMYGLVLSGLAMQMVGNSRPASGSEHHVSHLIEMDVITRDNPALHGEKVGVAAALVAEKYHQILSLSPAALDVHAYTSLPVDRIQTVFGDRTDEVLAAENTPDPLCEADATKLMNLWPEIKVLADRTLPTGEELRGLLCTMGAKATLSEIDLSDDLWNTLWEVSPYVRRRLTFMRLCKLIGQ